MLYKNYTNKIHLDIGFELNSNIIKKNPGDISFITIENIIVFCKKYDYNEDIKLILRDYLKSNIIKFYCFLGKTNKQIDPEFGFPCQDWVNFKPLLYLILSKIKYFESN